MTTDNDRPQDVGRRHARKRHEAGSDALLDRYQRSMRAWLTRLLDELDGKPAAAGLLPDDGPAVTIYPTTTEAAKSWDLAIKLGRELGSAIDPTPPAPPPGNPNRVSPKRIDYG